MLDFCSLKLKEVFEKNNVVFTYLFGSQVKGKTDFESDVDLAVYLNESCKDFFKTRLVLIEIIQDVLKKKVDIVILNEIKSIFLKFVIIKEGKVIFEKNHEKRVDFELKIMREYYDFLPFIKEYNKAYLERELAKV
ncbi:MAG: nucleotidyltransferase domain-containing protein [Patescibacteria group bacterium]